VQALVLHQREILQKAKMIPMFDVANNGKQL
jgi:hypothetical protein